MLTPSKVTARTDGQTDRHLEIDRQKHTHRHDENIISTAYAGGKNVHANESHFSKAH